MAAPRIHDTPRCLVCALQVACSSPAPSWAPSAPGSESRPGARHCASRPSPVLPFGPPYQLWGRYGPSPVTGAPRLGGLGHLPSAHTVSVCTHCRFTCPQDKRACGGGGCRREPAGGLCGGHSWKRGCCTQPGSQVVRPGRGDSPGGGVTWPGRAPWFACPGPTGKHPSPPLCSGETGAVSRGHWGVVGAAGCWASPTPGLEGALCSTPLEFLPCQLWPQLQRPLPPPARAGPGRACKCWSLVGKGGHLSALPTRH